MTFIDFACISVKGGNGGNGAKAFHKEKYVSHGGPSGGDGGNGGSVYFIADNNENTLLDFKSKKNYKAENGGNGQAKNMTGHDGEDLYIKVPVGTQILENDVEVADLSYVGKKWLASSGGKGGRGNYSFKSSKHNAPEIYEHGDLVDERNLCLNLRVLADVGLLGFPNAGKSTFISTVSNAKPKIADYQFTTLIPHLGMVNFKGTKFVITDLPGLIEGASQGKGMGHQFLKHLSRVKIILHLISLENKDKLKQNYSILRNELDSYSNKLSNLPEVIVFTKIDLLSEEEIANIKKEFENREVFFISSLTNVGIESLLNHVILKLSTLSNTNENVDIDSENSNEYVTITMKEDDLVEIEVENNVYTLFSKYATYWANKIPMTTHDNELRLMQKLKNKGFFEMLKKRGFNKDSTLKINKTPFSKDILEI